MARTNDSRTRAMPSKIAMISEHASPLAAIGGIDERDAQRLVDEAA
jgi:thiamine monophosphate synthase